MFGYGENGTQDRKVFVYREGQQSPIVNVFLVATVCTQPPIVDTPVEKDSLPLSSTSQRWYNSGKLSVSTKGTILADSSPRPTV